MKLDQFDKDIKNALEGRKIKPDGKSWDKISNRLDAEAEKQHWSKKAVLPAMVFIGMLILGSGSYFYPTSRTELKSVATLQPQQLKEKTTEIKQGVAVEPVQETRNVPEYSELTFEQDIEQPVALNAKEKKVAPNQIVIVPVKKHNKNEAQKVAAQIANRASDGKVSEAEVNSLIENALMKIRAEKMMNSSENRISASSLLKQAEQELDRSFREQVFEALNTSYKKVKVALINPNY
jgi:hypothetical protein